MPRPRGEELWVGACVEAALPGVQAIVHDDGSRPSMYDLELRRDGAAFAAMEVTAAADAESIELWNLINGSDARWIEANILGGWMVTVRPKARARRLRNELPHLLRVLEKVAEGPERQAAEDRLDELEVVSANRHATEFQGSIYVTLQRDLLRTGGAVPLTGDGVVAWFDEWVRQPDQRHNVEKLRAAIHSERHLFVLLPGFTTAPFSASDVLMRSEGPLPQLAPSLPAGVTDLWLMSTWSEGDVFHFDGDGWRRSRKVFEVAND